MYICVGCRVKNSKSTKWSEDQLPFKLFFFCDVSSSYSPSVDFRPHISSGRHSDSWPPAAACVTANSATVFCFCSPNLGSIYSPLCPDHCVKVEFKEMNWLWHLHETSRGQTGFAFMALLSSHITDEKRHMCFLGWCNSAAGFGKRPPYIRTAHFFHVGSLRPRLSIFSMPHPSEEVIPHWLMLIEYIIYSWCTLLIFMRPGMAVSQ